MAGTEKRLVFLDTHIVIWLYDALKDKFSRRAAKLINTSETFISPFVILETEYLYEAKKIKVKPSPVVASLNNSIGLRVSDTPLSKIIDVAVTLDWTRDPFDRLLVAEAYIHNAYFVSKDEDIRRHYPLVIW